MTELLRFATANGGFVVVEADADEPGVQRASRQGGIIDVKRRFEDSLADVRNAADSALAVFRSGSLRPDGVEIEFGVRLNAEAGAVIAKAAVEGHLMVRLTWGKDESTPAPEAAAAQATSAAGSGASSP
jgi:hypothetical protein